MPTYNAKCPKCQIEKEYIARISDRETDTPNCPQCGEKMETAYMPAQGGFVLKGPGWFKKGGY